MTMIQKEYFSLFKFAQIPIGTFLSSPERSELFILPHSKRISIPFGRLP